MVICDEKFLKDLNDNDKDTDWKTHLHDVGAQNDVVRILQVSDMHWQLVDGVSPTDNEIILTLRDSLRRLRLDGGIHGLVLNGDFVKAQHYAAESREDVSKLLSLFNYGHKHSAAIWKRLLQDDYAFSEKRLRQCVLAVAGNHDVVLRKDMRTSPPAWESFLEYFTAPFCHEPYCPSINPPTSPKLCLIGNDNGVVAFIGLDSNHAVYRYGEVQKMHGMVHLEQLKLLEKAIRTLAEKISDRPLYVVVCLHHHLLPIFAVEHDKAVEEQVAGLARVTLDTRGIVEELQSLCVSIVLHGHMHRHTIQQVSYLPLREGSNRHVLSIIACGQYEGEHNISLLSFDLYRGRVQVALMDKDLTEPLETSLPLTSASRISTREMRLYREMQAWLKQTKDELRKRRQGLADLLPNEAQKGDFLAAAEDRWKKDGYVQICSCPAPQGSVPFPVDPHHVSIPEPGRVDDYTRKYFLLLLFSRDKRWILMNNHQPLRTTDYGSWDTLLLPAFQKIRDLVERARLDIIRIREHLSLDKAIDTRKREELEKKLTEIWLKTSECNWEEWESELLYWGQRVFAKFSPTDGLPMIYDYTLVTFTPFTLRDSPLSGLFDNATEVDSEQIKDNLLRPDPRIEPAGLAREVRVAPGYHWFNLDNWRNCPSIVARNADVMQWVSEVVRELKANNGGDVPNNVAYEGLSKASRLTIGVAKKLPFDDSPESDNLGFPSTLKRGLRAVQLDESGPLRGRLPYKDCEIKEVHLRRQNKEIRVLDVEQNDKDIGVLRPTQRYVLRQGLKRARDLRDIIGEKLRLSHSPNPDPLDISGYLLLELPGGLVIAHLPPIIETISQGEWANSSGLQEFLVCDGNHRIIQYCWKEQRRVRAVLISNPSQPYYARPFAADEWDLTAENVLSTPPDLYSKYHPRPFEGDRRAYRAYYRDFAGKEAFKNVGGQGGRLL